MFLGQHTPKLDEKGRLILPAKFRDGLAEGLVLTIYQEYCLAIWTPDRFLAELEALRDRSTKESEARNLSRMFAATASDQVPDRQGRISVPTSLRQYAGLDKDVVVIGAVDRIEVWNPDAWARFNAEQVGVFAGLDRDRPRAS